MNEKLQAERDLRARIKTRLDHGCMFNSCQEHGPADAADITLVNCIYMAEHIRHYGTPAALPPTAPAKVRDNRHPVDRLDIPHCGSWKKLAHELAEVWWWCHNNHANLQHGELIENTTFSICLMGGVPGPNTFHADTPSNAMAKAKVRLAELPQCARCKRAMHLTPEEDRWLCYTCDHYLYAGTVPGPTPHEERVQLLSAPFQEPKVKLYRFRLEEAKKNLGNVVTSEKTPVRYIGNTSQRDYPHGFCIQGAGNYAFNSEGKWNGIGACSDLYMTTPDTREASDLHVDKESQPFYKLAELLHSIGWTSPNDAQWSELERKIPQIWELVCPRAPVQWAGEVVEYWGIPEEPGDDKFASIAKFIKELLPRINKAEGDRDKAILDLQNYREASEAENEELGRFLKEHGARDGENLIQLVVRKDRMIWELIQALSPFYLFATVYKDRYDILTDVLRHKHQGLCVGAFQAARETLSEVLKSCPTKQ